MTLRLPLILGAMLATSIGLAGPITLTILHTDDLHGHVEPFKIKDGTYGGYARHMTLVKRYMKSDTNPLLLSGGDTFQGTLYFNVYQGLADGYFMNLMGYMGMAVGNHEFDLGPAALASFAHHARFPVLACNLDLSREPLLKDLIQPHAILIVKGEKVGLIGAVTPDLPEISSVGPNVKMLPLNESIQKSILQLQSNGVNKVILLSHLGYEVEKKVAAEVPGIDVIVGGHSHTLLGKFNNPDFPPSEGPYPTVIRSKDGVQTLILAAWEWGKVLGRIKINFSHIGRVVSWDRDANPIVVDSSIPEDPLALSAIAAFKKPLEALGKTVISQTDTGYDGSRETVRKQESPMANIIADAMLAAGANAGAVIGFINGGGVRAGIDKGPITYEEAIQVQPFNNTLAVLELTGAEILLALEYGVSGLAEGQGRFLQVSKGFSYTFDPAAPVGSRVKAASLNGQPIDPAKTYRVAMNQFMATGGDGFQVFKDAKGYRVDTGTLDVDILIDYLRKNPNLRAQPEGRIKIGSAALMDWLAPWHKLAVPETLDFMIVHHAHRLHERITYR